MINCCDSCRHKINIGLTETQKEKDALVEECEKIKAKLQEIQAQKGTEKSEMDALNKYKSFFYPRIYISIALIMILKCFFFLKGVA